MGMTEEIKKGINKSSALFQLILLERVRRSEIRQPEWCSGFGMEWSKQQHWRRADERWRQWTKRRMKNRDREGERERPKLHFFQLIRVLTISSTRVLLTRCRPAGRLPIKARRVPRLRQLGTTRHRSRTGSLFTKLNKWTNRSEINHKPNFNQTEVIKIQLPEIHNLKLLAKQIGPLKSNNNWMLFFPSSPFVPLLSFLPSPFFFLCLLSLSHSVSHTTRVSVTRTMKDCIVLNFQHFR